MDQIETWHDAPDLERMEAKIKALNDILRRMIEVAMEVYERGEFYGNTYECEGNPVVKLKKEVDAALKVI